MKKKSSGICVIGSLNPQKDAKHVVGGISTLSKGNVLVANDEGKLEAGEAVGVHFVVSEKTTLTEPAIKVVVTVA